MKGTAIRCGSIKTLQEGPTAIRLMSALLGECVIAFWEVRRRLLNELDREGFSLKVMLRDGHMFIQHVDDVNMAKAGFEAYKNGCYVKGSRSSIGCKEPAISVKLLDKSLGEYTDIYVNEELLEQFFLTQKIDYFAIYQLHAAKAPEDIHFMGLSYLIAITRENYQLIYVAPLEDDMSLEDIFTRFNTDRPADFKGHSLSVSDIVVLNLNGMPTSYYVDIFGYKEIPEFTEELMSVNAKAQHPLAKR